MARTCELAHSNNPPTGAKTIPMIKKRGRTVFGVRMGLGSLASGVSLIRVHYCHAFKRCCLKAVSVVVLDKCHCHQMELSSLAGLRDLTFFSSPVIEEVCVCDILCGIS